MLTNTTEPKELARMLGTTLPKLTFLVYAVGASNCYVEYEIAKKNGQKRSIKAPNSQLKVIQRRLLALLEKLYEPHEAATAFIRNRGIRNNARRHVKRRVIFNIDIEKFYDQIHFGRIYGLLVSKPYCLADSTAKIISNICCCNSKLPQGAPTSPIISNMICKRLDRELSLLAKAHKARYSRYADDITFSFHSDDTSGICLQENGEHLPHETLSKIVTSNGFTLNSAKTKFFDAKHRQVVTGLKVNAKVNLDRRFVRTTKAMLHSLSYGIEEAQAKKIKLTGVQEGHIKNIVAGRINYIGMILGRTDPQFRRLAIKFNKLPLSHKINLTTDHQTSAEYIFELSKNLRDQLERCVWVLDFDGIEGADPLVQGTAFVIHGKRIITAAHTFDKAGAVTSCFLHRIHEPGTRLKALLKSKSNISDIAELEFDNKDLKDIEYLKLAPNLAKHVGYKLAVVGFPQLQPGHHSVSITPCTVINTFVRSGFNWAEVDSSIIAGNSGGPVVNALAQVVGMALRGQDVTVFEGVAQLEGSNAYISAEHFQPTIAP